jgi:hypothetical protein
MEKTPRPSLVRSPVMVVQSLAFTAMINIWAMLRIPPGNEEKIFFPVKKNKQVGTKKILTIRCSRGVL